ncbi:MAG: hypothetical protein ACLUD2_19710 [Clostridium sp.]
MLNGYIVSYGNIENRLREEEYVEEHPTERTVHGLEGGFGERERKVASEPES